MKSRLFCASLAAFAIAALAPAAKAGCIISPDGKSINVVTDNGSSDAKSCSVSCKVDTKIGVVQVACGGTTPPFAKGHSLCDYDKPEAWYKKVVSSEDSCKGGAANAAPAPVAAAPALKPGGFACRISPDGKSVDAVIVNPYKTETSCQIDCELSTTKAGTTFSVSCGRPAAPGAEAVLCSHSVDQGKLVKMVGGKGSCTNPEPSAANKEKDDDEVDPRTLIKSMPKPSAANKADEEELSKIGDDPAKLQDFMNRKMDAEMQKALGQINK